jgi:hypothetical protein
VLVRAKQAFRMQKLRLGVGALCFREAMSIFKHHFTSHFVILVIH